MEGITRGKNWECGFEFDYANQESLYCRPLRTLETNGKASERMPVPDEAENLSVAFLPPMSGLAANETRLDAGAINVRIGEGRTAEVLRNLCYQISQDEEKWNRLCQQISDLFGVQLDRPDYVPGRGELTMSYTEKSNVPLDLSSSGRGLQQTLLLLAYVTANPGAVLLLDEPEAHLEILRHRQIYQVLTKLAREHGSQIVAASYSQVILNEAADRDIVIAFLGKPHRINHRGDLLRKSLRDFGFEQYYQAQQRGWVLYLEGSTDLLILRAFAEKLGHPAQSILNAPHVYYVKNRPSKARRHFYAMQEVKSDFVGFCLCDRISSELHTQPELKEYAWQRCEIENYIIFGKQVLMDWARDEAGQSFRNPLFAEYRMSIMEETIIEIEKARATLRQESPWSPNIKVTDDFLEPLFETFFEKLEMMNSMRKTNYHTLVQYLLADQIDPEVTEVLDAILEVANAAVPVGAISLIATTSYLKRRRNRGI